MRGVTRHRLLDRRWRHRLGGGWRSSASLGRRMRWCGAGRLGRLSHDRRLSRRRRCRRRRFRFRALSGDSRRSGRRRVGFRRRSVRSLVAAFEGHHFGEFVAPRLIHERPVARDVGRFPRGRRRQGGGRGHHLRLSVRQHTGLDDGLRRAMGPIQDNDRRNGDAGCKRHRERALALQERTLCFGGRRDHGAVPILPAVDDRTIILRDRRVRRLAVRARRSLGGARRRLLRLPLASLPFAFAFALVAFACNLPRRFRLRRPNKRDQVRDALFRSSLGVARPARAVLGFGDEQLRGLAKNVVPVRPAFLRKPDRRLVAALRVLMSVMNVGVFGHGFGRDQTDMRIHRTHLPSEIMCPEGGGARREDR